MTANFNQLLKDLLEAESEEREQQLSIDKRLKPLGWTMHPRIGAGYDIDWRDRYDRPVATVDAYPPMKRRDPATGKYVEARLVTASDAKVIAKIIVDCVNHHDGLVEALIECRDALPSCFARDMATAMLERVGYAGNTDSDLAQAVDSLGNGVVFA